MVSIYIKRQRRVKESYKIMLVFIVKWYAPGVEVAYCVQ
jgi:hypothetical protein